MEPQLLSQSATALAVLQFAAASSSSPSFQQVYYLSAASSLTTKWMRGGFTGATFFPQRSGWGTKVQSFGCLLCDQLALAKPSMHMITGILSVPLTYKIYIQSFARIIFPRLCDSTVWVGANSGSPLRVLTFGRIRTTMWWGNQIHSSTLWTLGFQKMIIKALGY